MYTFPKRINQHSWIISLNPQPHYHVQRGHIYFPNYILLIIGDSKFDYSLRKELKIQCMNGSHHFVENIVFVEDVAFIGLDEFNERTRNLHSLRGKHNEESTQLIPTNTSNNLKTSRIEASWINLSSEFGCCIIRTKSLIAQEKDRWTSYRLSPIQTRGFLSTRPISCTSEYMDGASPIRYERRHLLLLTPQSATLVSGIILRLGSSDIGSDSTIVSAIAFACLWKCVHSIHLEL